MSEPATFPLPVVTGDRADRPTHDRPAGSEADVTGRLAIWLADVAADTALASARPEEPTVAEATR